MQWILYYTINGQSAVITRCVGDAPYLALPENLEGYPVTALGADCFAGTTPEEPCTGPEPVFRRETAPPANPYDNKTLRHVTLPRTLRTLGERCFAHCSALSLLELPKGLRLVGSHCFHYCGALERLELPEGLTALPDYALAECRRLTRVTLPHSVRSIGRCCFYNCIRLTELTLPDALESIGDRMLMNCFELHTLSFRLGVNAGALLPEIDRVLRVNVNMGDQVIQMVLPEFATEYEELIQAKQFRTHEYGSGALYRSCFSDRDIDFALYDDYFYYCVREDPPELAAELAFDRLRWPVELRPAKAEIYWDYLTAHTDALGRMLLERNDLTGLDFLLSQGRLGQAALRILLELAQRGNNVRFVSRLLEAVGTAPSGADKSFEL